LSFREGEGNSAAGRSVISRHSRRTVGLMAAQVAEPTASLIGRYGLDPVHEVEGFLAYGGRKADAGGSGLDQLGKAVAQFVVAIEDELLFGGGVVVDGRLDGCRRCHRSVEATRGCVV
jgi:hypothetical protein